LITTYKTRQSFIQKLCQKNFKVRTKYFTYQRNKTEVKTPNGKQGIFVASIDCVESSAGKNSS